MFGAITRRVPQVRNLKFFLTRRVPPLRRVLLVESGSRDLFNKFVPGLYNYFGEDLTVDLVTCYAGVPEGFRQEYGAVYRVYDYAGRPSRRNLYRELRAKGYDAVGIICSGEPIMTKWKWAVAANVPAKLFVMNENGDYFWADRSNWRTIRHFFLFRAGLSGAEAVPALGRLLLFPFALVYLALYAAWVHTERRLRHI